VDRISEWLVCPSSEDVCKCTVCGQNEPVWGTWHEVHTVNNELISRICTKCHSKGAT